MNTAEHDEFYSVGLYVCTYWSTSDGFYLTDDTVACLLPPPEPTIGYFEFKLATRIKNEEYDRNLTDDVEYEHQSVEIAASHNEDTVDSHKATDEHDAVLPEVEREHLINDELIYTLPNNKSISTIGVQAIDMSEYYLEEAATEGQMDASKWELSILGDGDDTYTGEDGMVGEFSDIA